MAKIVLLGYMGCGKSAIARSLNSLTGLKKIDLDDYIESQEQMSIKEIFNLKGEIYFRNAETHYLRQLLEDKNDFILSLGGGTPCFGNNLEIINAMGISVYLQASIPTLVKRLLPEKAKRPLIAAISDEQLPEFIAKHLFERNNFYNQARLIVKVDDKPVGVIANEIVTHLPA